MFNVQEFQQHRENWQQQGVTRVAFRFVQSNGFQRNVELDVQTGIHLCVPGGWQRYEVSHDGWYLALHLSQWLQAYANHALNPRRNSNSFDDKERLVIELELDLATLMLDSNVCFESAPGAVETLDGLETGIQARLEALAMPAVEISGRRVTMNRLEEAMVQGIAQGVVRDLSPLSYAQQHAFTALVATVNRRLNQEIRTRAACCNADVLERDIKFHLTLRMNYHPEAGLKVHQACLLMSPYRRDHEEKGRRHLLEALWQDRTHQFSLIEQLAEDPATLTKIAPGRQESHKTPPFEAIDSFEDCVDFHRHDLCSRRVLWSALKACPRQDGLHPTGASPLNLWQRLILINLAIQCRDMNGSALRELERHQVFAAAANPHVHLNYGQLERLFVRGIDQMGSTNVFHQTAQLPGHANDFQGQKERAYTVISWFRSHLTRIADVITQGGETESDQVIEAIYHHHCEWVADAVNTIINSGMLLTAELNANAQDLMVDVHQLGERLLRRRSWEPGIAAPPIEAACPGQTLHDVL